MYNNYDENESEKYHSSDVLLMLAGLAFVLYSNQIAFVALLAVLGIVKVFVKNPSLVLSLIIAGAVGMELQLGLNLI